MVSVEAPTIFATWQGPRHAVLQAQQWKHEAALKAWNCQDCPGTCWQEERCENYAVGTTLKARDRARGRETDLEREREKQKEKGRDGDRELDSYLNEGAGGQESSCAELVTTSSMHHTSKS